MQEFATSIGFLLCRRVVGMTDQNILDFGCKRNALKQPKALLPKNNSPHLSSRQCHHNLADLAGKSHIPSMPGGHGLMA